MEKIVAAIVEKNNNGNDQVRFYNAQGCHLETIAAYNVQSANVTGEVITIIRKNEHSCLFPQVYMDTYSANTPIKQISTTIVG